MILIRRCIQERNCFCKWRQTDHEPWLIYTDIASLRRLLDGRALGGGTLAFGSVTECKNSWSLHW
jgi:hypothetical protein